MKVKKGFCADRTECICIALTHFSLQPLTAETGFYSSIVQLIFVVIILKLRQGFLLLLSLRFQYRIIDISYPFPCCSYKTN